MTAENFITRFPPAAVRLPFDHPTCPQAEPNHLNYLLALLEQKQQGQPIPQLQPADITGYQDLETHPGLIIFKPPPFGEPSGIVLTGEYAGLLVFKHLDWLPHPLRLIRGLKPENLVFLDPNTWLKRIGEKRFTATTSESLEHIIAATGPRFFAHLYAHIISQLGFELDQNQFLTNIRQYHQAFVS